MKMMKSILYALIAIGLLAACYEDNSKLPSVDYPSVVADKSQEAAYLLATYGAEFTFEPVLCKMVGRDTVPLTEEEFNDYAYRWDLTVLPNANDTTKEVLSHERILKTVILSEPSSGEQYYSLTLQMTHKASGVVKNLIWRMKVTGTYGAGLLVAETTDEATSDLSLIMSRTFNSNLPDYDADVVHRNLYTRINGLPLEGLVTSVSDIEQFSSKITLLVEGKSMTRLNPLTMKVADRDLECFYYAPQVYNPQVFIEIYSGSILLNNGLPQYYDVYDTDKYSLDMESEYRLSKACVGFLSWDDALFFDEQAGKFLRYSKGNALAELMTNQSGPFDPNNLPGCKCIYGEKGYNRTVRWLMEKEGHYYVYEMAMSSKYYNSSRIYDLSNCTGVGQSKGYAFSASGDIFYYAAGNQLYAVPLNADRPSPVVAYDRFEHPGEEITHLKIHRRLQGRTTWSKGLNEAGIAEPYWRSSTNNVLVVVTYDGTEGRIYTLPIQYGASGLFAEPEYVNCYDQFGRITAIGERN